MGSAPWYTTQVKIIEFLLRGEYFDEGVSFKILEAFLNWHRPKTLRALKHLENLDLIEIYRDKRRKYVKVTDWKKLLNYQKRLTRKIVRRREKKGKIITPLEEEGINIEELLRTFGFSTHPSSDQEAEKYLSIDTCRDELCMTFKIFEYIKAHERSRALFKKYIRDLEKKAEGNKKSVEATILTNIRAIRSRKTDPQHRLLAAAYLTASPIVWKTLLSVAIIGKQMKERGLDPYFS